MLGNFNRLLQSRRKGTLSLMAHLATWVRMVPAAQSAQVRGCETVAAQ